MSVYGLSSRGSSSLTELLGQLSGDVGALVRQEVHLATAEMTQKMSEAGAGAAEIVVGAVILGAALQLLLAAAVIGLAQVIGWWQSALVLGVVVLLVGAMTVMRGLSHVKAGKLAPRRTLASLRQSGAVIRRQVGGEA